MSDWYERYFVAPMTEMVMGRRELGPLMIPVAAIAADSRAATEAERGARKRRVKALTTATRSHAYVRCWVPPKRLRAACQLAHGISSRELGLRGVELGFCRPAFHAAEKNRAIAAFDFAVNGFTFTGDDMIWINAWEHSATAAAHTVAHELLHCAQPGADDAAAERYATQFWQRHGRQIAARFGTALRAAA